MRNFLISSSFTFFPFFLSSSSSWVDDQPEAACGFRIFAVSPLYFPPAGFFHPLAPLLAVLVCVVGHVLAFLPSPRACESQSFVAAHATIPPSFPPQTPTPGLFGRRPPEIFFLKNWTLGFKPPTVPTFDPLFIFFFFLLESFQFPRPRSGTSSPPCSNARRVSFFPFTIELSSYAVVYAFILVW